MLWGQICANKRILLHTNNKGVLFAINCLLAKCPLVVKSVRHLVLLCLELNIWIKARHISGASNTVTDALSRFQFFRFQELVPWAEEGLKRFCLISHFC